MRIKESNGHDTAAGVPFSLLNNGEYRLVSWFRSPNWPGNDDVRDRKLQAPHH